MPTLATKAVAPSSAVRTWEKPTVVPSGESRSSRCGCCTAGSSVAGTSIGTISAAAQSVTLGVHSTTAWVPLTTGDCSPTRTRIRSPSGKAIALSSGSSVGRSTSHVRHVRSLPSSATVSSSVVSYPSGAPEIRMAPPSAVQAA